MSDPWMIDPHVHLWDPRNNPRLVTPLVKLLGSAPRVMNFAAKYAFPKEAIRFFRTPEHATKNYLPADFDADCGHHPVAGLVYVEASWEEKGPLGPVGETRWVESLRASGRGRVEAIVAHADLSLGRDVRPVLQAHLDASPRVRGIRDMLAWHASRDVMDFNAQPGRSASPAWRAGFECLSEFGLSFDAFCYDTQLGEIAALARAYPEQPIMLCHMGGPVGIGGPYGDVGQTPRERSNVLARWRDGMERVAACPNVQLKLSGLAMPICGFDFGGRASPPGTAEVVDAFAPLLEFAIDTFGVDRCSFASNFPVEKASLSYAQMVDVFQEVVATRSQSDRRALFRDNAARFYRIDP